MHTTCFIDICRMELHSPKHVAYVKSYWRANKTVLEYIYILNNFETSMTHIKVGRTFWVGPRPNVSETIKGKFVPVLK
jgi:hypothetical protein